MYQDRKLADGRWVVEAIGWTFSKTMRYEDAREDWPKDKQFYVRCVWVELRDLERDAAKAEAVRAQVVNA